VKLINLTNDPLINLYLENGSILSFPQKGILRVDSTSEYVERIDGLFDIRKTKWSLKELPPQEADIKYIVSSLTAMAIRDLYPSRRDFICPNTHPSQVVKDYKNRVIGCLSFQVFD